MRIRYCLAALLALAAAPLSWGTTLHGYCGNGQCVDNGTNSPTSTNPLSSFGFTASPGPATGNLILDLLIPDNDLASPSSISYAITGTLSGTANLFSAQAWTSGSLSTYLGISASPSNPIGAYLPSTQTYDAGATGFYVFQVNLGHTTLNGPSNPGVSPLENMSAALPQASYVIAFLNTGTANRPSWSGTANSGAIFETGPDTSTTAPEPDTMLLLGGGLIGLALLKKRPSAPGAK